MLKIQLNPHTLKSKNQIMTANLIKSLGWKRKLKSTSLSFNNLLTLTERSQLTTLNVACGIGRKQTFTLDLA
jgi:hypothetical protein